MRVLLACLLGFSMASAVNGADETLTAETILAANRASTGPIPVSGSVRTEYRVEQEGLTGTAVYLQDLSTGAFAKWMVAGPVSSARGFDAKIPWQRDLSGFATDQEGGDRIAVAMNEAYRNANLWWRPDHGGAKIAYVGREGVEGGALDHLVVTPKGGTRFDAWFDADTHLLVRTAEPQQFFHTQTMYGDYRREGGMMVAHSRATDFGTGPSTVEKLTLTKIDFGAPRPLTQYARPHEILKGGRIVGGRTSTAVTFRLLNNHIYVDAKVNGRGPYTFIVDTGGHALLSPRLAREVGLTPVGRSATSGGGEKTASSAYAHYGEVALGDMRLTNQTAVITDIYDKSVEGIAVDGMLGVELFARFAVRLDYGSQTMTITDFGAFDPEGAGTRVPFVFYDHMPNVGGFIDRMPARFNIDTGSRSEVDITSPFVASMDLRSRYSRGVSVITGWGVGGASRGYVVRIPSLTLGATKATRVVAGLSEAKHGAFSDPNYAGNIGSGYLKRYVVTFDYAHQAMYLKAITPPPADAGSFDRSGLWLNAADDGLVVMAVVSGSPAAEAELAQGDLIIAIDGQPMRPEELSATRRALRVRPAGTTLVLTVKRGAETRIVRLILREMI